MKFVFLMDPLDTVHEQKDTTFALMLGADRKGHTVYFCRTEAFLCGRERLKPTG